MDKNKCVAVNGDRRWSSKAAGTWSSPARCRSQGGEEDEDGDLLPVITKWYGLARLAKWATLVGFGQVSQSPLFSVSFSFLFLLISFSDFN
jgi:hypothetical protein